MGLFIALLSALSGRVFAVEDAGCNLSRGKLDELKSIQENPDLDYAQKTAIELRTRKALLEEIVDCSIKEAVATENNLAKTDINDSEVRTLRSQFISRLDDAANYYELQKSKIGDLGLQGSRNFARDLKDWRDGNYKPATKLASNFIIWSQNQGLMQSAKNRLDQIASAVNILKLVYDEKIQNLWRSANESFNKAREANLEAKLNLRASLPDEALNSLKTSLSALSQTYSNLSDLFANINWSLRP